MDTASILTCPIARALDKAGLIYSTETDPSGRPQFTVYTECRWRSPTSEPSNVVLYLRRIIIRSDKIAALQYYETIGDIIDCPGEPLKPILIEVMNIKAAVRVIQ